MESVWIVMSYLIAGACGCVVGVVGLLSFCALVVAGRRDAKAN